MKTIYVVTAGDYSDYRIIQIFEDLEDAERFCAIENSSGRSDSYSIEFWDLTESGTFQKVECHKAIGCRFLRMKNSGFIGYISWHMEYSKEPFSFEFECIDYHTFGGDAERFKATIPVAHTYDLLNVDNQLTAEKIVRDSYYMWRAMKEGIC